MKNKNLLNAIRSEKNNRKQGILLSVKKKLKNRNKYLKSNNFEKAINDTLDWIHARINKINV